MIALKYPLLGFLIAAVSCGAFVSAEELVQIPTRFIRFAEYPAQGVLLGQGWNSFTNHPVMSTCITFDERTKDGHDIAIRAERVTTRSQLNRLLKVSASASYKGFGVKVGGTANFSRGLNIDQSKTNILVLVEVDKGDSFVAPVRYSQTSETVTFKPVSLTADAKKAAEKGIGAFRALCGDSFVASIDKGAALRAMINATGLSRDESRTWAASISGKGFGANLRTSADTAVSTAFEKNNVNIQMHQVGGPLSPVKFDIGAESFTTTVSQFLTSSSPGLYPVNALSIGYLGYEHAANWPKLSNRGVEETDSLMNLYFLFLDLHEQYLKAVRNPSDYIFTDPNSTKNSEEVLGFNDDTLCRYRGALANDDDAEVKPVTFLTSTGVWENDDADDSKKRCPKHRENIVSTTFFLDSFLIREQRIKDILGTLEALIDSCVVRGKSDPDKCLKKALSDKQKTTVSEARKERLLPSKDLEPVWDALTKKPALVGLATDCEAGCVHLLAMIDDAASDERLEREVRTVFGLPSTTVLSESLNDVRKAVKAASAKVLGAYEAADPYISVHTRKYETLHEFLVVHAKTLHYLLMKAPLVRYAGCSADDTNIQCGVDRAIPTIKPAVYGKFVRDSRDRREEVLGVSLDLNYSLCKEQNAPSLCLNVSDLRKIADDADLIPTIGIAINELRNSRTHTKCRDVWRTRMIPGPFLPSSLSRYREPVGRDRTQRYKERVCWNYSVQVVTRKLTSSILTAAARL